MTDRQSDRNGLAITCPNSVRYTLKTVVMEFLVSEFSLSSQNVFSYSFS